MIKVMILISKLKLKNDAQKLNETKFQNYDSKSSN